MTDKIFENSYKKVISRLEKELPDSLAYHNAHHTEFVVEKAKMLADYENIKGRNLELIKIAALYHDTGFLLNREDHESNSCQIATQDLHPSLLTQKELDTVCGMIMATKIPQRPHNILEKIVADADLFYLGTPKYTEFSRKLFIELTHFDSSINEDKWLKIQIGFLSSHSYHTSYGKEVLEPVKRNTLKALIKNGES
ncbi:HD domain-containing protein [uncultured Planktosalinus sp.]|uniref:HD domain-containing protein n=1 Tax=uncultured Planktosalinus sp. TaxID=1810935 RepID=UPI0030DD57D4